MQNSDLESISDEHLGLRQEPPRCDDLHMRIIAATKDLPQALESIDHQFQSDSELRSHGKQWFFNLMQRGRRWFALKPLAALGVPMAAVSVLALTVWLAPLQQEVDMQSPIAVVANDSEDFVVGEDSESEPAIIWGELILLYDELAFAGI